MAVSDDESCRGCYGVGISVQTERFCYCEEGLKLREGERNTQLVDRAKALAELAKAFHDGPLMADDHEFVSDSGPGEWCMEVARFFAEALAPDLTDDMVVRAMEQIPGVDHDDMVRALQAALGLEIEK